MKEKTVIIQIDEQGNSSIVLEGFHGKGCTDVAKDFQGHDVVKNVRTKPEFYFHETAAKRQQQRS